MPIADPALAPRPLEGSHIVDGFACGVSALDEYLVRRALADARAGKSRTYVATRSDRVVAYYSLAAASLTPADASDRAAKGQGAHDIPAILIARFAVDRDDQRRGVGSALLVDALARCAQAADVIGVRLAIVHANDEGARRFYERHGFEPSPANPLQLMVLMKDVRKTLGRLGPADRDSV